MLLRLLFVLLIALQQEVPFKPESEYSIRLDLKLKARPSTGGNKLDFTETQKDYDRRTNSSQLPFLNLMVTIKEVNQGEIRMRIERDNKTSPGTRKIEPGKEFALEVGFTDDARDGISGYKHVIYFLTADKKEVNRIEIRIEKNGDYFINDQKRGRL